MLTKRLICTILCALMLFSLIPLSVFAGNGPFAEEGAPVFLTLIKTDENGNVVYNENEESESIWLFRQGKVVQENQTANCKYDLSTNTLTIKDFDMPQYVLEAAMMGDDLKLVVEGDCKLGTISILGWSWGGSLEIQGTGTLTINKGRLFANAISLTPESGEPSILKLGENVSLNLYGKNNCPVAVFDDLNPNELFDFANDASPPTARVNHVYTGQKHVAGFFIDNENTSSGFRKCICASDPDGIYGAAEYFREVDENDNPIYIGWWVYKYIYSETFERYFKDYSFGEGGELDFTLEEFENSEYSVVVDEGGNDVWNDLNSPWSYSPYENVFADEKGVEYVIYNDYSGDTPNRIACTVEPIPEIPGCCAFRKADGVDVNSLKELTGEYTEDTFDTVITGSEYIYKGKTASKPFRDVPDNAWFEAAALWCSERGFITGTGEGTFSPDMQLTRAMFVQILAKVAGVKLDDITYGGKFTDVKAGDWFAKAVQWAVDNKITGGTSETTFSPNTPVTREQLAVFFYAYSKSMGYDVSAQADLGDYSDAGQISSWAVTAIKWAVAEGLISGTSKTTISPKGNATRAQAAVIFKNYVEIFIAKQK